MIPLRFFRDKTHVYVNNPKGITKKMTIAEFEDMMSGESILPEYSSSNEGEVLSVDSSGDLDWISLPNADSDVLKVLSTYDETTDTTTLDKTYSEISNALADGKTVTVYDAYQEEDVYVYATVGFIQLATYVEDRSAYGVYVTENVGDSIFLTLYIEVDGVLTFESMVNITQPRYRAFVFVSGTIYNSGSFVYNELSNVYCYFTDGTAGQNNEKRYLPTEFGKNGSTYYVVLSNGDRYEGGETGNMTKVAANP